MRIFPKSLPDYDDSEVTIGELRRVVFESHRQRGHHISGREQLGAMMMKRVVWWVLVGLVYCGCAKTIVLKDPRTGRTHECKGDTLNIESCARIYERDGWVRLGEYYR